MTASTLPLLVLIAFLWWKTKGELLPIILFTSIFDAASALNVAGSPISPWILALVICLPAKILSRRMRWKSIPELNRPAFLTLVAFIAYALFSSVAFPFLFHGILVSNARNGNNQHLAWTFSNFAQPCYLLAAFTLYLIGIHSTREQLRLAVVWYIRACICIACFSMYQLANAILHVPFPSAILYSNTTHVIFGAYKISGVWRLNSTLTEASAAAFYLSVGLALHGWQLATHRIRWQPAATFLLMLTALVLTVSSTGYACLVVLAVGGGLLFLRYSFRRQAAAPIKVLLLLAILATAVPLLLLSNVGPIIGKVFQTVLVDKKGTDSYRDRTMLNTLALQTSRDSYYFGAGWGSVRASSLACSLMGNVGIPGVLLFTLALLQMLRPLLQPRRYARFDMFERSLFALAIVILAHLIAGSDPIAPILWVLFAVATASKPWRLAEAPVSPRYRELSTGRSVLVPQP